MPKPPAWQTFGGREADQPGCKPLESDLLSWADQEPRKFSPVQAQALLCSEAIFAQSYRKKLVIPAEWEPGEVRKYNKSAPVDEDGKSQTISVIKCSVSPMHLLVLRAYYKDKVNSHTCEQPLMLEGTHVSSAIHFAAGVHP